MPNRYFQFKQFRIEQGRAAMKVGTDGVLLGAFADLKDSVNILDIGSGTGLIALMAAQRNSKAEIDALEIDLESYKQMLENFNNSPWNERLTGIHTDFNDFVKESTKKYSHIISNPPFFSQSKLPDKKARNLARHDTALTYQQLVKGSVKLMNPSAKLSIIIPDVDFEMFDNLCKDCLLFLRRRYCVLPTPHKDAKRLLLTYSLSEGVFESKTLVIESGGRHNYSPEYIELTREFYLGM